MKREDSEGSSVRLVDPKSKYKLLVLDFDYTMTDCHTHNTAMDKGKQKAVTIGQGLVVDGVKVVVASHSKYPKLIEVGLVKLGLTPDETAQIHVICGEPLDSANGKNEHIDIAKKLHGIEDDSDVLLVDDSILNRCVAIKRGIDVVSVIPLVSYLYDAKVKMGHIEEGGASTDYDTSSGEEEYEDEYEDEEEDEEEGYSEYSDSLLKPIQFNKGCSSGRLDEDVVDTIGDHELGKDADQ